MITSMVELMRANEAPAEQYQRLGLPQTGPISHDHLQVRRQWDQVQASRQDPPRRADYPDGPRSVHVPLRELLADDASRAVLERHLPRIGDGLLPQVAPELSLIEIAAFAIGLLPVPRLEAISAELSALN
jgi:hypothetical protein